MLRSLITSPFRVDAAVLALLIAGCGGVEGSQSEDVVGLSIKEQSPEARAILELCNQADEAQLAEAGLAKRQSSALLRHRRGKDAVDATPDDDPFGTLREIDAVPDIGPATFKKLLAHVQREERVLPVTVTRAPTVSSIPREAPADGAYRVHLIDVGAGLAILVQGADFTLLFDGGSSDDKRGITASSNRTRLLSYLFAALGPSGPAACKPSGDPWPSLTGAELTIDHVFLSHPHEDHMNMLDEVLRCYRVKHVWDPGAINDTTSYLEMVQAVAAEPGVTYHTAAPRPADRTVTVAGTDVVFPSSLSWKTFASGDSLTLGDGASARVLFADGTFYPNQFNRNSTVLRLQLGPVSALLAGDIQSSDGDEPYAPAGEEEAKLLDAFPDELDVDLFQVGHHGSSTSTRVELLRAVSPQIALLSAGTTLQQGGLKFPDRGVVDVLDDYGLWTLRTDEHDAGCPEADHVGVDDDRPGGCDSYVLEIGGE